MSRKMIEISFLKVKVESLTMLLVGIRKPLTL
jgi:hypothetical protein